MTESGQSAPWQEAARRDRGPELSECQPPLVLL